jgi:hypothetical protein
MKRPLPDLSDLAWTNSIAQLMLRTGMAIAVLDARISVSPVRSAWTVRASWSGYARALAAQGEEFDEIDIFGRACGVPLPGRPCLATTQDPFAALAGWQARFGENALQHWTDPLTFPFDPPEDWGERPALLRALELLARWARHDPFLRPWLELPLLLQRLGLTRTLLPNLVAGDKTLRRSPRDREVIVSRLLRGLRVAAEDGLGALDAMERDRQRAANAIGSQHRPGKLGTLCALMSTNPVLSPTVVAQRLALTISGAGKLLERAAALGLCHEVSGRQAWRLYLTPDLAVRFGFRSNQRGRPPALPAMAKGSLDAALAAFDVEMAALETELAQLGVVIPPDNEATL